MDEKKYIYLILQLKINIFYIEKKIDNIFNHLSYH